MTKKEKTIIREQMFMIASLDLQELTEKEQQISFSMMGQDSKNILYRAIHLSRIHDSLYNAIDSTAVCSEISEVS